MERRIQILKEAGLFAGQLAVRMKRDAINDIIGEDLALQDYLAEELREFAFDEDDPVSCLKYATKVLETLNKAYDHINKGYKMGLSEDERQLTDMLFGFAPHNYQQEYVDLAKEVAVYINKKLRGVDGQKLSRERRKMLVGKMLTNIDNIAKKRGIELERSQGFCFELLYVGEWIENKICS